MTPIQIAYFKHFMFDKGIQAVYISMYRSSRITGNPSGDAKGNPESLEQFLQETPYFHVIMKAFYFPMNSDYGYDYWKDINKKWQQYWKMHEDNFHNDKYVTLKGSFAILRQNWDTAEYWKTESLEDTYKRMHIEPPIKTNDIEQALHVPNLSVSESLYKPKEEKSVEEIILPKEETSKTSPNPGDLMEGFSLVEINGNTGGRSKMETNIVSVNMKSGFRILFPIKRSMELRKKNFKYLNYLTNKAQGIIAFQFNNTSGYRLPYSGERRNLAINSKEIVTKVAKFFNQKRDYFTLEIIDTIAQDNGFIFKLKLRE